MIILYHCLAARSFRPRSTRSTVICLVRSPRPEVLADYLYQDSQELTSTGE